MSQDHRDRMILDLELELSSLIRRIKRVVGERARTIHPDLTPTGYLVMAHMSDRGAVRASAVAEAFSLDKGAVSRHLQTLVDLDLAARERDPDDGRAWVVSLSDEGRRRLAELTTARRARLGRMLGDWSDEQLSSFVATLGRYNASLDD